MNKVEDVLMKSNDIPALPFEGILEYKGISFHLDVLGTYMNNKYYSLSDKDYILNESTKFDAKKVYTDKHIDEVIGDNIHPNIPVTDIRQIPARQKETGCEIPYEYNSTTYIVNPKYRFIYTVELNNNTKQSYYCIETNKYKELPKQKPKHKLKGIFKEKSSEYNIISFKSTNIFSKIFKTSMPEFDLKFDEKLSYYNLYELENNVCDISIDSSIDIDYSSVDIKIEENKFVIYSKYNQDDVKFKINLTSINTLPEWTKERIDSSILLSLVDSDKNLIAKIKKSNIPSKWTSEDDKYELIKIE